MPSRPRSWRTAAAPAPGVLADEVYERLYYEADTANGCAPSFLDVSEPDDRLVVVHSFSKSFLMTGWRLGWLVMPPAMTHHMGKLIEFNTSCAPVFVQRAGLAALADAPVAVPALQSRLRACRDTLVGALEAIPGESMAVAMLAPVYMNTSGLSVKPVSALKAANTASATAWISQT